MFYPVLVAVISALFAARVIRDYVAKRKPHHGLWSAALTMSCLAAASYAVAAASGSELAFKLYYLFGALLVAPYTGMGSLFLALRPQTAKPIFWALLALSVAGAVLLLGAPVDTAALAGLAGSSGRGVLEPGAWLAVMIVLNVFGTVAVVGVAAVSVLRAIRSNADRGFVAGNALIGCGFLVLALAGSVARWVPGWDGGFWVTTAAGWVIAYLGFRSVTKAAEKRAQQAPAERKAARA